MITFDIILLDLIIGLLIGNVLHLINHLRGVYK